jgi:hypothetical protein
VSSVFCEQITGEQIDVFPTTRALLDFDPQKVLYVSIWGPTVKAFGPIQVPQLTLNFRAQSFGGCAVRLEVNVLHLLPYNPVSHWVNVIADHITAHSIGLQEGSPASHEGIGYTGTLEVLGLVEGIAEGARTEFSQQ